MGYLLYDEKSFLCCNGTTLHNLNQCWVIDNFTIEKITSEISIKKDIFIQGNAFKISCGPFAPEFVLRTRHYEVITGKHFVTLHLEVNPLVIARFSKHGAINVGLCRLFVVISLNKLLILNHVYLLTVTLYAWLAWHYGHCGVSKSASV